MSQYGAEGAGRQGLGYREIVEFYYPGTKWGTGAGPVSVLITADTSDDLVVEARSGLRSAAPAGPASRPCPTTAPPAGGSAARATAPTTWPT